MNAERELKTVLWLIGACVAIAVLAEVIGPRLVILGWLVALPALVYYTLHH